MSLRFLLWSYSYFQRQAHFLTAQPALGRATFMTVLAAGYMTVLAVGCMMVQVAASIKDQAEVYIKVLVEVYIKVLVAGFTQVQINFAATAHHCPSLRLFLNAGAILARPH